MASVSRAVTSAALIVAIFNSIVGCATTVFSRERHVSYESLGRTLDPKMPVLIDSKQGRVLLSSNCGGDYTYTGMLSPIVPLPPIFPVWFLNYDRSSFELMLFGSRFSYSNPKMTVIVKGKEIESRLKSHFKTVSPHILGSSKSHIPDMILLSFSSASCLQLNGAKLTFSGTMYDGKPFEIPPVTVIVKNAGFKFHYGYIHD